MISYFAKNILVPILVAGLTAYLVGRHEFKYQEAKKRTFEIYENSSRVISETELLLEDIDNAMKYILLLKY